MRVWRGCAGLFWDRQFANLKECTTLARINPNPFSARFKIGPLCGMVCVPNVKKYTVGKHQPFLFCAFHANNSKDLRSHCVLYSLRKLGANRERKRVYPSNSDLWTHPTKHQAQANTAACAAMMHSGCNQ